MITPSKDAVPALAASLRKQYAHLSEMKIIESEIHFSILLLFNNFPIGGLDASILDEPGDWQLNRLIVQPKFRNVGLGSQMLKKLQNRSNKIIVHPGGYDLDLDEVINFYKHMGFKETNAGYIWQNK